MRPPIDVAQLIRAIRGKIGFPGRQKNAKVVFEVSVEDAEIEIRARIYGDPVLLVHEIERLFGVASRTVATPYGLLISGEYMRRHLSLDISWGHQS